MKVLTKLLILIFVLTPAISLAQHTPPDPEEKYREAIDDYNNGYYVDSHKKFAALADSFPDDSHNSVFRFMAAKSLYKAGDYMGAAILWNDFIVTYPTSSLLGEAWLFKGHSLYLKGDIPGAAGEYIKGIDFAPKSEASELARANLISLISRGLSLAELQQLIENNPSSNVSEETEYELARREIDAGHFRKGMSALKSFMARYPGSRQFKQARLLFNEAQEKSQNDIVIGLLAPVTGSYQDYGRSMVEAAQLALKGTDDGNLKIELAINDTQGDPIIAAKSAAALAQEEPVAVVGPLRSESALSAAIILNERNIPMITPTASENGLASIGPNIFQLSPSMEQVGRTLARYAIKNLKINEFAIVAPDDNEGTRIANAFAEAVYELGGEIIVTTYYTSGATDFKQYITPLREILLARIDERLSAGKIDSSDFYDSKNDGMLPRDKWPVRLGGLFLPGSIDDLKLIIPQIRYNSISARFLGSDSWDSDDLMREVKNYVDDAIFATDFHADSKEQAWSRFETAYQAEYHHPPDKVAALTYDAIKLVIDGIAEGYTTPDDMRLFLSNIDNYQGVSSVISFKDNNRANEGVGIYSIDGKRLVKSR